MRDTTIKIDWIENKAAKLIATAKRSEWKHDIFSDADYFRSLGYVGDVALAMSLRLWLS